MILNLYFIFFLNFLNSFEENCDNWNRNYSCKYYEEFSIPDSWDERGFQTPPRNDIYKRYKPTYQDMHYFVGYAQLSYSSDKKKCTIKFLSKVNPKLGKEDIDYYILYKFGDIEQLNNTIILTSENSIYPKGMPISAKIIEKKRSIALAELELDEVYFMWDNPIINSSPEYENGQKGGIVEFFGWPYEDISLECEFLSHAGYMGLKVYSPNEHLINYNSVEDEMLNPWWIINQPVSYKLNSRMGTRKELKKMINLCRSYNLRIYADITINHMTGTGYDMYDDHRNFDGNNCVHWNERDSTGGSPFWTVGFRYENNPYTGLEPGLEYPSVPYFPSDFHCVSDITNWDDPLELDGGWVVGLADLNTDKENVQQRIVDYFVDLLSIGFSGFSIPNSKHIYPKTYAVLFKKLKNSLGGNFPEDFIAILQIVYGWEKHILMCEETKRSCFGDYFTNKLIDNGLTNEDIEKIKIWNSGFPQETPECNGNWKIAPERHAISIENPDDINLNSYYNVYIRDKDINIHRERTMHMFNNTENNWKIKSVFSMFSLINGSTGFPDGKSDCKKCKTEICKRYCTKSFPYQKAYDPLSIGYDTGDIVSWKEGTYTRVHRDLKIINSMREWMNLTLMTEEELYYMERIRANCSKECLICDNESKKKNMCLICNKTKGFYPIIYPGYEQKHFNCLNSSLKYERLYFNESEEAFMPCYESCRECDRGGNPDNHNCLKCDVDLIERPGMNSDLKTCVVNCTYKYNITSYGHYKCVEITRCTKNFSNYIREKNICIDECKKDDTYQYSYQGICFERCPENTQEKDFICLSDNINDKPKIIHGTNIENNEPDLGFNLNYDTYKNNECTLIKGIPQYISFQDEKGGINDIIKSNKKVFYTNKNILQLQNNKYNVVIYKDSKCLDELSLQIPKIDFGLCYIKAKENAKVDDNLIIVYAQKEGFQNPRATYSLYNPSNAEKIDGESICQQDSILIEKNISFFFNNKHKHKHYEILKNLEEQGINLFNSSHPFYQEICYHFESPIKKDITLKDRILEFYPNITLCDPGCEFKGVNLTTNTCVCLCRFNDIMNNELIKDNIFIEENINDVYEIISNSNLEVLLCIKYVFKNIDKSIGGFIISAFILICIIFTIIFYLKDFKKMQNYITDLTENYIRYISVKTPNAEIINEEEIIKNNNNLAINKNEKIKKRRSIKNLPLIIKKELKLEENKKKEEFQNRRNNDIYTSNKLDLYSKDLMIYKKDIINDNRINDLNSKKEENSSDVKNKEFYLEYLTTSLDDLDFDDAIQKDHRSFFEYLCDSIVDKQIIVNTFYSSEPLNPISLKIVLFILTIDLYFVVNGLFYSEEYISEIYHTENEKFFSFIPRSINRFIYSTIVSIFISFLIDCFFIEEKKIKGIFIREKNNIKKLKMEIALLIKKIKKRYFAFILVTYLILIFSWFYLLCFNYVYPYTQYDWIKSSIVLIILIQILSLLTSILETLLRYISFFFKSEKIFRVSKLLE